MKMNLRRCAGVFAMMLGIGLGGGAMRATAAPFDEHQPDYSKNKTYQLGMREGQADQKINKDHSKKRHYRKDEDQKSYEAGYQKGRGSN